MLEGSCHCGAIRIEIDAPLGTLNDCNCSICRRLGVLWAYFSPTKVRLLPPTGATSVYMWSERSIEFHACPVCHCTTHWAPTDKTYDRMGINARLLPLDVLSGAAIRKSNGAGA